MGPREAGALEVRLRTPQAAAVAGIVFALVLIIVLWALHTAIPFAQVDPKSWIGNQTLRNRVQVAAAMVPFAGISFLWFIGVIRTRLGALEDRLFATVFFGTGILFVAMMFVATAITTSMLALSGPDVTANGQTLIALQELNKTIIVTYGARMAAVFMMVTSVIGWRTRVMPRWLVVAGYVGGLLLLFTPPLDKWVQLLFPVWVLLLSLQILVYVRRHGDWAPRKAAESL